MILHELGSESASMNERSQGVICINAGTHVLGGLLRAMAASPIVDITVCCVAPRSDQ